MSAVQNRIFYACQAVGLALNGDSTYTMTAVHGVQSVGINTTIQLEQVFELGQISIYQNLENIPDVEVTIEKYLDGYCPVYLLATQTAPTPSLTGRSGSRTTLGLSIYSDLQNSASGTPTAQCMCSGLYISQVAYSQTVQGEGTEQVTFVGNDKTWSTGFTSPTFNNQDAPLAIAGSGGVQRRQDFKLGSSASIFPLDLPGVSNSGTIEQSATTGSFNTHLQSVKTSCNLGRDALYELGRRGVYYRYAQFPVEVRTEFEILSIEGDQLAVNQNAISNVNEQHIFLQWEEGLTIDLGVHNKLSSVTYGGGNAGRNGGNATDTFTYITFNDFTVRHPQDPNASLRN